MSFKSLIWEALRLYRQKPIIVLPPSVLALVNITMASINLSILLYIMESPPSLLFFILPLLSIAVNILVSFLVIVGLAGMTRRLVLEGHTSISDWGSSIKTHFRVVLGLGIIFGSIFILSSTTTLVLGASLTVSTNPFSTLRITPIARDIVTSLPLSLFYIVLAPAMMEGKGLRDSLRHGLRAARGGLRVYVSYLGIVIIISIVITANPIPFGETNNIVSEGVRAISSPFLFILAFLIYRNKKGLVPSTES